MVACDSFLPSQPVDSSCVHVEDPVVPTSSHLLGGVEAEPSIASFIILELLDHENPYARRFCYA